jgi:hypothetical protein
MGAVFNATCRSSTCRSVTDDDTLSQLRKAGRTMIVTCGDSVGVGETAGLEIELYRCVASRNA